MHLRIILLTFVSMISIQAKNTNFVIVLGDDINRDSIGCYGGGVEAKTPNIDRLAREGVRFDRAYTSVAMCAPFRQELYSGRTPWRTKTLLNHSKSTANTTSLPHYLSPLGYRVALVGKKHIGPAKAYPFQYLGDSDDNTNLMNQAKRFMNKAIKDDAPFCIVIASHDAHAEFTNGDPSEYPPDSLDMPPYWIDTPEFRAGLPAYLAEVSNFDELVGKVDQFISQSAVSQNTVMLISTEQGSQFPYAKWTCFDNGLRTGLIAYGPNQIAQGHVSDELLWMCDIAPTILTIAGGEYSETDFDGKNQLSNFMGKPNSVHNFVYGAFSNKGIADNHNRIYPIRSIRSKQFSLIYSPNYQAITSNVTLTKALSLFEDTLAFTRASKSKHDGSLVASWVATKGKDHPLVRRLFKRPEYALYDLNKDPNELHNLASNPEYEDVLISMKQALNAFLRDNNDTNPIKTEKFAQKKN